MSAMLVSSKRTRKERSGKTKSKIPQNLANYVQRAIHKSSEDHFFTTSLSQTLNTTAVLFPLNLIAQGDDVTNRSGDQISAKKMEFRYIASNVLSGAGSVTAVTARVMFIADNQANGVVPVVTDVLTASTTTSLYNTLNPGRFNVLYDEIHDLSVMSASATAPVAKTAVVTKITQLGSRKLQYITNAATQAALGKGALYFLAFSDFNTTNQALVGSFKLTFSG